MSLIAMVATDEKFGIGKDGTIPWHCKQDFAVFKKQTLGKVIVMGRKTLESLPKGKPLEGRTNIVLTRKMPENGVQGVVYATEIQSILDLAKEQDVVVIGGSEIYELFEPHYDEIHETSITGNFDCDTFCKFESCKWEDWEIEQYIPSEFKEDGCIAEMITVFKKYDETGNIERGF